MLTQEIVTECFEYVDGELLWRVDRRKVKPGTKAGRVNSSGYREVRFNGKLHGAHRIIYLMFHGELPKVIDHIDGNPLNNKIENLRAATYTQNMWNSKRPKNNTSGVKGISWIARIKKWQVECYVDKQKHRLGFFKEFDDAKKAIHDFRNLHHGQFANHG